MKRSFKGFLSTLLVALCGLILLAGCGTGDNSETVYLHVFNGYAGVESMSVYGPSGTITTGLPFGARTAEPVEVDRNLGTDMTVVLDGAPTTFDFQEQLYNLYPQETATLVMSRRENNAVSTTIFRHQPSISPACRLIAHNSLSLNSGNLSQYNFILGWDFSEDGAGTGYGGDIETTGYDEEWENARVAPDEQRSELFDEINDNPIFTLVPSDEEEAASSLEFVWIGPERTADFPRIDYVSGSIVTFRSSIDYVQCLEDQEDAENDPDVEEEDCDAPITTNAQTYSPGLEAPNIFVHYYPSTVGNDTDSGRCDADFRVYSDFGNIFTGEPGYDGFDENRRLELSAEYGISNQFFFVLYGNPTDPRRETWVSGDFETGGGFVPPDPYPGE